MLRSRTTGIGDSLLALILGLLVLTVGFQIPLVGVLIQLVVFCFGPSVFTQQLYRGFKVRA